MPVDELNCEDKNQLETLDALHNNLEYAYYGILEAKKRFPLGALNRKDNTLYSVNATLFWRQHELNNALRRTLTLGSDQQITERCLQDAITMWPSLLGARCAEFASFAQDRIVQEYPHAQVEFLLLPAHQLLVIGRAVDSNPEDSSTWGDTAVICDPWAEKAYSLSEFTEQAEPKNDIPFYKITGSPSGVRSRFHFGERTGYLTGVLKVVSNDCSPQYRFFQWMQKTTTNTIGEVTIESSPQPFK